MVYGAKIASPFILRGKRPRSQVFALMEGSCEFFFSKKQNSKQDVDCSHMSLQLAGFAWNWVILICSPKRKN